MLRLSSLIFAAWAVLAAPLSPSVDLYVAVQSMGILEMNLDPSKDANHSLTITSTTNAGYEVNWITMYQDQIYSISRSHYPDNTTTSGGVFEFESTDMTLLSSRSSGGAGGVFLDVSPDGRTLAAANYDGGTVSIFPLSPSGTIEPPTYTFHYTLETPGPALDGVQTSPNPHQAIFDPSGRHLFVTDHAADRFYVYVHGGPRQVTLLDTVHLDPGTGPRHFLFSPIDDESFYFYLVSDLDNSVRVFCFKSGTITLIQLISTLGLGAVRTAPDNINLAAELQLSSDGRFMYASNRNTDPSTPDTITIFSRNTTDGTLTYMDQVSSGGKTPRAFAISPDAKNRYMAVANEVTQDVTVFVRDEDTGMIGDVVGRIVLGEIDITTTLGPLCVLWK